jgi:hypothetical protein
MNTCYHVSSRHLVLVSPVFKRLLKKEGFSESYPSKSDGLLHINATDLDAEAFLVVLQIIHLRNKQAPRAISLELLAKIAVIVNYYDCGEAIELFTEMWIQRLKNEPFPMTYCRDLVLWIWIACVFDVEDYFKQATAVAIRESQEPLRTMNLPIREWVSSRYLFFVVETILTQDTDEMDLARYQAIESIVEGLHALLKDYRSATYVCPTRGSGCSFACGSFLLGALSKGMDAMGLLYPRPEVPFEHVSFNKLCDDVQNMHSPSWREYYSKGAHGCTLNTAMTALITDASAAVTGLDINFR